VVAGQFEKYPSATVQTLGVDYDFSSIMHYGPSAFTRNGLPTIVPKRRGASIGQRSGFSKLDSYKINTLYGKLHNPSQESIHLPDGLFRLP